MLNERPPHCTSSWTMFATLSWHIYAMKPHFTGLISYKSPPILYVLTLYRSASELWSFLFVLLWTVNLLTWTQCKFLLPRSLIDCLSGISSGALATPRAIGVVVLLLNMFIRTWRIGQFWVKKFNLFVSAVYLDYFSSFFFSSEAQEQCLNVFFS